MTVRRTLLAGVVAISAACAATVTVDGGVEPPADVSSPVTEGGAQVDPSPLFGCVDPPEDRGELPLVLQRTQIWVETGPDQYLSMIREEIQPANLMASASVGPDLGQVGEIVVPRSTPSGSFPATDPDLIEATQFATFIVGFTQTRSDEEWGRIGAVLGVDERGQVHFLGNCESHLTDAFRDLVMVEVPELAGLSERDAWLRLVGDEALWPAVEELWYGPPPADPVETWLAVPPDERVLDRLLLGPEPFAELQQVGLDVVLPSWWAETDLALCPLIPEVAWTEECLGSSLGEATVQLDAWVDQAGVLELHLVDSTNPPSSVRRVATIEDLWGRGTSVRVMLPATVDEALTVDDAAVLSDGDRPVDTTPGLPGPAVHVDADDIPQDG